MSRATQALHSPRMRKRILAIEKQYVLKHFPATTSCFGNGAGYCDKKADYCAVITGGSCGMVSRHCDFACLLYKGSNLAGFKLLDVRCQIASLSLAMTGVHTIRERPGCFGRNPPPSVRDNDGGFRGG